jgi:hypothetical protein
LIRNLLVAVLVELSVDEDSPRVEAIPARSSPLLEVRAKKCAPMSDDPDFDIQAPPGPRAGIREISIEAIDVDGSPLVRDPPFAEAVVEDYREALRNDAKFPAIVTFDDGVNPKFWVAEGRHRIEAHRREGRAKILANIRVGSRDDCVIAGYEDAVAWFYYTANDDERRDFRNQIVEPWWRESERGNALEKERG